VDLDSPGRRDYQVVQEVQDWRVSSDLPDQAGRPEPLVWQVLPDSEFQERLVPPAVLDFQAILVSKVDQDFREQLACLDLREIQVNIHSIAHMIAD